MIFSFFMLLSRECIFIARRMLSWFGRASLSLGMINRYSLGHLFNNRDYDKLMALTSARRINALTRVYCADLPLKWKITAVALAAQHLHAPLVQALVKTATVPASDLAADWHWEVFAHLSPVEMLDVAIRDYYTKDEIESMGHAWGPRSLKIDQSGIDLAVQAQEEMLTRGVRYLALDLNLSEGGSAARALAAGREAWYLASGRQEASNSTSIARRL